MTGGQVNKPQPIDRPGNKNKNNKHIGKGAMPKDDLKNWLFNNKK